MATRGRKRINPIIMTNNVDKLCDMVNEKYKFVYGYSNNYTDYRIYFEIEKSINFSIA